MEKNKKGYDPDPKEISEVLKSGEEVRWEGKPDCASFLAGNVLGVLPLAFLFGAFGGLLIYFCIKKGIFGGDPTFMSFFLGAFLVIFFLPVYVWLFECLTAIVQYKNTQSVFTDRRVIAKKWRWGRYLEIVDYKKIVAIDHVVRFTDKVFVTGDVIVECGKRKVILRDLKDPAGTARELRKIVKAVKEGDALLK